jgi:hypothetical protein
MARSLTKTGFVPYPFGIEGTDRAWETLFPWAQSSQGPFPYRGDPFLVTKYQFLLQNPLWKQRRGDYLAKKPFCEKCGNRATQVHHKQYIEGRKPWEYLDGDLMAVCDDCHRKEHAVPTNKPFRDPSEIGGVDYGPVDPEHEGEWVMYDTEQKKLVVVKRPAEYYDDF